MAKAVLVSAVPPLMLKTEANPGGLSIEVFDGFREGTGFHRAQTYLDIASGPFYGFNRPGAEVSEGVIRNWWRQGMMGGVKAHYDGIKAFSETDQTVRIDLFGCEPGIGGQPLHGLSVNHSRVVHPRPYRVNAGPRGA